MQLKYLKSLIEAEDGAAKVTAMGWSPNNLKLAVVTADRVVQLFDESGEKRDKFSTKPADPKYGKKSYIVRAVEFSPDSTRLAVAQTDNIVFVYKIGDDWSPDHKKVICNKFIQTSAVTALAWPTQGPIVVGLADGKVRAAHAKTNKATTLYSGDSYTVALACNMEGTGFLSGHVDGTVVRWYVADDPRAKSQGKVLVHPVPPYALAWASQHILAAGCDKKLVVYTLDGAMFQQFDYFSDPTEKEFTVLACSPSGQAVCAGSFDRVRVYSWAARKNLWEENAAKEIKNLYSVTAMAWKRDGSRVAVGSLCGAVEMFESVLRRAVWKNRFEMTYVGPSQVLVKPLVKGSRGVILKSVYGHEIDDVRIMGGDNYLVARTAHTMLLGDLQRNLLSEIPWGDSGGHEKFYFENANVCMIFNAGELSLVEYGKNEVLGTVRTEFMNPHLISVRINERKIRSADEVKRLAYLLDLKTIVLEDLVFGYSLGQVQHDSKIDWLELNETGRKLLFRDKRSRLNLVDVENGMAKSSILNYCTFVQWVPGSDVVVAQTRDQMAVFYNIEAPERVTLMPIKGDVTDVLREDGKTEVLVVEGQHQLSYELDEGLIEFGTAVDDGDFNRAIAYLESLELSPETEAMWRTLARMALEGRQLHVAERCYAALGDVAKARYLRETLDAAETAAENFGGDGTDAPEVWARLYVLDKQFKAAEGLYLEQNQLDEAIRMYRRLHMWDDALNLADAKAHPQLDQLRAEHMRWLLDTGQEEKAGAIRESEGDYNEALNLYLKGGLATRASRLLQSHGQMLSNDESVSRVTAALLKGEFFEQAGELYEHVQNPERALESYRKAGAFSRAVELARRSFPAEVTRLEEEWGNNLAESKQLDAAISHFIEAGKTIRALDAAIGARQWKKAVQIAQVIEPDAANADLAKYYVKLAQHYASIKEYPVAQRFFLQADMPRSAVEMYNAAGMWEEAHKLASKYMDPKEVGNMYVRQAQQLEDQGKLKEAEKLYISVKEPDLAISMYKKHRQYEPMTRLVQTFHPDLLQSTHVHLAQELEQEGNLRAAEHHFLEAGDWKSAVHMYRTAEHWEDAHRVAQAGGGPNAAKQVTFLWARTLGGEAAVKLLNKFGLLEQGIDFACDSLQFEFAFDLARLAAQHRTEDVHFKYAMALEDEGRFSDAESHFVRAKKPKEAVLMYVHNQDWESAQRVAEAHDEASLGDILIGQAKIAFENRDLPRFESLLLRAQRPDLAVKQYRDSGMWPDALRVCKEYLPSRLRELQDEYDRASLSSGGGTDSNALMQQARKWEESGDYGRAVDCYAAVERGNPAAAQAWTKAAELAVKFLDGDRATEVAERVGPRLVEAGRFSAAAQLYLGVEMIREAIDAFIAAQEWSKAKKVARELEPRLESYVDQRYKDHLRNEGQADQLASVDLMSALDMMVEQGQWTRAIEAAGKQGQGSLELQHKYIARKAAESIQSGRPADALQLYKQYGAPPLAQNFNIYKRIAVDLMASPSGEDKDGLMYPNWSTLRDVLFDLTEAMSASGDLDGSETHRDFRLLLRLAHYLSVRSALQSHKALQETCAKISVSLLRHSDVIPADKAFYEAGEACKKVGWDNMAFVFLNHYLDLHEAIEEHDPDMLDDADLTSTDFPREIPLPERPHLSDRDHEKVKEWVLAVSMDRKVQPSLPKDDRGSFEGSLVSVQSGESAPACIVTGYPVLGGAAGRMEFSKGGLVAIKDEWNKLVMLAKTVSDTEVQDLMRFVGKWSGTGGATPGFSFK